MKLHVLPFGKQAWDARRRILSGVIEARPGPPYDFRDVAYLVPNERTVLTLRALFLEILKQDTGASACLPPRFSALNRFMEAGASRHADRPVVDDTTRTLALEEIARSVSAKQKGLSLPPDTLAPSMAPLIARALDGLYVYGVPDERLGALALDSLPASLLLGVKRGYEAWLKRHGLSDPAAAMAAYTPGPDEFAAYATVVLDGFYDADPAELRTMKALAGARDFRFVLEAPGLSDPEMRREGMPYFGTDKLISALGFEVPEPDGGRADEEASAISGAVFGGRPLSLSVSDAERLSPLSGDITLVGAVNPHEEAYFVADAIKRGALSGEIPDINRVAVYLAEPETYLPMAERAFRELGITYHTSSGRPILQSPVAAAILRLLSVPKDGYTFSGIRAALSSPLITLGVDGNHPEAFARFGRTERITRGRRAWLERLDNPREPGGDVELIRGPLTRLMELLDSLPEGRARLSGWCAAMRELISGCGIEDAVSELSESRPELAAALGGLKDAVESIEASAARLTSRTSLPGFMYVLRKTLAGIRYTAGERRFAGVRILGGLEILTEPFDTVFACGLTEGALPKSHAPDIFFQGPAASGLGLPGRDEHDTREARKFLSIMLSAARVYLCRPEAAKRGQLPPSPYLRSLGPFVGAGAVKAVMRWCRPTDPAAALSPAGLMRGLAISASLPGGPDAETLVRTLESLPPDTPGLDRAKSALMPRKAPAPHTPPGKTEFSVTELEEYILCHYRYYHDKVLGSAPPEDPDDDIAPHRAGSIVHAILGEFYTGAAGPVTPNNMEDELKRLNDIAGRRFGALPDTLANRELKRRFAGFLAPRFIETEARLAGSGFEACGFEHPVRIELPDEGNGRVIITGKIDRVELAEDGGFVVADYKTGAYPGSGRPIGELFQLPLYAYMLKAEKPALKGGRGPERPVGFVYYNLKDGSMRDVMLYEADTGVAGSEEKPRRKADADKIDERVVEAYNKAVDAVKGILTGRFEPSCDKPFVCERCVYVKVCEKGSKLDEPEDGANWEGGGAGED